MTKQVDIVVIGGGPAGLAAAIAAKKAGADKVLILERNEQLGGILNQCIHEGFGVEIFKEALTGPEYVQRYIDQVDALRISYELNSMVLDITSDKNVFYSNEKGFHKVQAKAIILAMGCRERTRGQVSIPGTRPAGIYTAGCAQNFINLQNRLVGKKIVILGSGDVGLIMARRLTLEGAKVLAVVEVLPYSSGLPRNIVQCLDDYDIPLYLSHIVTNIKGKKRVEAVTIAKVDEKWDPIPGTEKTLECDTLLLSVGLIPENELSRKVGVELDKTTCGALVDEHMQTSVPGIFACGNVLQVHDMVDFVSRESEHAGKAVAEYVKKGNLEQCNAEVIPGKGIRYAVPHLISGQNDVKFHLRVLCPGKDKKFVVKDTETDKVLKEFHQKRVNPAEMIQFTMKKEELKSVKELNIWLE